MELSSPVGTDAELDEATLSLRHATEEQLATAIPLVEISQHMTRAGFGRCWRDSNEGR